MTKKDGERKVIAFAQLKPFLQIAIPFFKEDPTAFYSLLAIITLTLLSSALNISFSYVRRDIFDALNDKDERLFYTLIVRYFLILLIIVPISVSYNYLTLKLAIYWRKELTARVLDKYYSNRTYYIIECCKDIDNPDQRICEDLTEFTSTSLDLFFIVFDSFINLVCFSVVLFEISPLLFVAIIFYAIFGTLVSIWLGSPLVGQYYDKLQREADFRFGLIRTRENAEGIAFYDSKATMEQINLWTLFEKAIETQLCIIRTQRRLEFFTTSYDYLVYVIPYLVVAPLYFAGKTNLGSITQSSEAFFYVRSSLSILVNNFEKLSAFSAGIDRLSTFIHRINQGGWQADSSNDSANAKLEELKSSTPLISKAWTAASAPGGYSMVDDLEQTNLNVEEKVKATTIKLIVQPFGQAIDVQYQRKQLVKDDDVKCAVLQCVDLSVLTPDGYRVLIGGLIDPPPSPSNTHTHNVTPCRDGINFTVNAGDRVLLVGPSGTGKSSLLRAISGLWELGSGTVTWNSSLFSYSDSERDSNEAPDGVFFLPQKPYNLLGSLRQQIAYPDIFPGDVTDYPERHQARLDSRGSGSRAVPFAPPLLTISTTSGDDRDRELLEILRKVRLETLASRMGSGDELEGLAAHNDWTKVLSLGEQQRLAFARVLYNRRSITVAVLDEATSALDEAAEGVMYDLLSELKITYISVGHRASLYKYHDKKLSLNGPGCEVDYDSIKRIETHSTTELTELLSTDMT